MLVYRCLCSVVVLLFASLAWAQDVKSGPAAGDPVPALKVHDVTGANQGKDVDYAAERKDRPTIYAFVQADKFSRPMHRFLSELNKAVQKDVPDGYLVAVWLTATPDETKEFLPRIGKYYENAALTCFTESKEGPKDWGVNGDAHVTVVVAHKKKVGEASGYMSVNETDVPSVVAALKKAIDKK